MKFSTKTAGFICLITLLSCSKPRKITPAFYHWKTEMSINSNTDSNLNSIDTEKLYVKFFDIDWSDQYNEAIPHAEILVSRPSFDFEIIPTVFITNRTFFKTDEKEIEKLAKNIGEKLKRIYRKNHFKEPAEIQFDCDWSSKTKAAFFNFLKDFKTQFPEFKLSSTIRLHQIKFFKKTGVPPVARGMLMFYNMSDVSDWETSNSILDLAEAKKYLSNIGEYPLPLDVALPAYSWGALFRNGELIKLLPDIKQDSLTRFEEIENHRFLVNKSTYFAEQYLYENDMIRYEFISPDSLLKAANLLSDLIENPNLTVSFYHLGTHSFEELSKKNYKDVLEVFEKK